MCNYPASTWSWKPEMRVVVTPSLGDLSLPPCRGQNPGGAEGAAALFPSQEGASFSSCIRCPAKTVPKSSFLSLNNTIPGQISSSVVGGCLGEVVFVFFPPASLFSFLIKAALSSVPVFLSTLHFSQRDSVTFPASDQYTIYMR